MDNNSIPSSDANEEDVLTRQEADFANRIQKYQDAARTAKKRCRDINVQYVATYGKLAYLHISQFFRETVAPFLGWKWAVAVLGTAIACALFVVLFCSWIAGFCGLVLGASLFVSIVVFPSDLTLRDAIPAMKNRLAELSGRWHEARNRLLQAENELAVVEKCLQQTTRQLEQYHESRLYRLRMLAAQNWKAMRGGDLEAYLEQVFGELQYSVERTGKSGDQGVDLIVCKDSHRIAVQVKGYLDSVPNTAIQEAFTGMAFYKCNACAVITNSRFTQAGKSVANSVGCVLIDEETMPLLILGQLDLWQEVCRK